jgi:hypothetical protein
MGMWDWAKGAAPPPDPADAAAGEYWFLTPFRELTLMHAVQQPLKEPTFFDAVGQGSVPHLTLVDRSIGDTFADLKGEIFFHANSTGKIDLIGEWTEVRDDLLQPGPETLTGNRSQVFENNINYGGADVLSFGPEDPEADLARQEFGDTKFREVTYHVMAATRFREQFVRVDGADAQREEDKIILTRQTPESERQKRIVPSSARPEAPDVLYVVPLFGWVDPQETEDKHSKKKTVTRKRKGGGLRVYMRRPWFSSGDRELLGVVVWPRAGSPEHEESIACPAGQWLEIEKKVKPYVSQWGMDPIWRSDALRAPLTLDHFLNKEPMRAEPQGMFTLEELTPEQTGPYDSRYLMNVAAF